MWLFHFLSCFTLWTLDGKIKFREVFIITLMILIAFLYIYLNVVNSIADYSTYNKYGDHGYIGSY